LKNHHFATLLHVPHIASMPQDKPQKMNRIVIYISPDVKGHVDTPRHKAQQPAVLKALI
jgi:hypothetical protein